MKTNTQFFIPLAFLFIGTAQAAVAPTIKAVSVTPTTAPAGTMFKFTAELKSPLTTGNKVKIDLGKGLALMTGTKTSYSLSRAIYTTGAQTYKVGVYNAKNALQGKFSSGNYTVSNITNNPPTLTLVSGDSSIKLGAVYTLQLKATDSDNNLRSITVDWKDSSIAETQTTTNDATLTFTHIYAMAGKFELSATAKDSGTPSLTSIVLSKTIDVIEPPAADYSKICNSGALEGEEDCPINPELGTKPTDWACTKDNKTGLIWEVKTKDWDLRNQSSRYSWYDGAAGYPNGGFCKDSNCDTYAFTNAVNTQGLCGANDWRMPTSEELLSIVKSGATDPSIDTTYFPNTESNGFWSSSLSDNSGSKDAKIVNFNKGDLYGDSKYYILNVRLVRSDKPN